MFHVSSLAGPNRRRRLAPLRLLVAMADKKKGTKKTRERNLNIRSKIGFADTTKLSAADLAEQMTQIRGQVKKVTHIIPVPPSKRSKDYDTKPPNTFHLPPGYIKLFLHTGMHNNTIFFAIQSN